MLTPLKTEAGDLTDLTHEARRFRTFAALFRRNLELIFQSPEISAAVDHAALAAAFSRWRQAFDENKALADVDRQDFIIFAAGLMLKELIAADPLRNLKVSDSDFPVPARPEDRLLARWPQGYVYASCCLSLAAAVIREGAGTEIETAAIADEPRFWDSFRENSAEAPELAVAYFDVICKRQPNWSAPYIPGLRAAMKKEG